MKKLILTIIFCIIINNLLADGLNYYKNFYTKKRNGGITLSFGFYKSYFSFFFKIFNIQLNNEKIHYNIFIHSFLPNYILMQITGSSAIILNSLLNMYVPDVYDFFRIPFTNTNILNMLTLGENEPWSISIFFGDIIPFIKFYSRKQVGIWMLGWVITYSNLYTQDAIIIQDNWFSAEWKLIQNFKLNSIARNFIVRFGFEYHQKYENMFIASLKFSQTDFRNVRFFSIYNFKLEFLIKITAQNFSKYNILKKVFFLFGKKFPLKETKIKFTKKIIKRIILIPVLNLGFQWDRDQTWKNSIQRWVPAKTGNWFFFIKPTIEY